MRCQHCNQNEATTFIKRNINGHKEELHLCSECAKELGVMDEFRMPTMSEMFGDTFLGNFLGAGVAAMNSLAGVDRCLSCGSSLTILFKAAEWVVPIVMTSSRKSLSLLSGKFTAKQSI